MLKLIQRLGRMTLGSLEKLGRANLFILHVLAGFLDIVPRFRLLITQIYSVGVLSILIVSVSGLFVGMVLSLQGYTCCRISAPSKPWGSWWPLPW